MLESINAVELGNNQRVELREGGIVWLAQVALSDGESRPACEITIDAPGAMVLLDFLLVHANRLIQWRDQPASL